MKREVYRKVVKEIEKEDWDFDQVLEILCEKFPFEHSATLRSILHQEYQKRVKRKHKEFNSEEGRKKIVQDFKKAVNSKDYSSGVILRIAKEKRFSPTQIGKIILEEHLKENATQDQVITKQDISKLLKNTAFIQDQKLSTEIWLANLKDNNYGVTSEWIKSSIGYEYERKAKKSLEQLGLTYQDEHDLRYYILSLEVTRPG